TQSKPSPLSGIKVEPILQLTSEGEEMATMHPPSRCTFKTALCLHASSDRSRDPYAAHATIRTGAQCRALRLGLSRVVCGDGATTRPRLSFKPRRRSINLAQRTQLARHVLRDIPTWRPQNQRHLLCAESLHSRGSGFTRKLKNKRSSSRQRFRKLV